MLKLIGKKIFTILHSKILLILTYGCHAYDFLGGVLKVFNSTLIDMGQRQRVFMDTNVYCLNIRL